jgi:hypothetical protein
VTGSVTAGSTTLGSLSTTELYRINVGDEIRGFGLPAGTTVAAKSTGSLTLSQASTGTTSVTTTGTRSTFGTYITVTSTTGILPGMTVSGLQVPTGTKISSVDSVNKIVYLNININPLVWLFGGLLSGTMTRIGSTDYVRLSSVSGLAVGQYVDGGNVYQNTTTSSINPLTNVVALSKLQAIEVGIDKAITVRFGSLITATSSSYTFAASDSYTIRPDASLPFGSFPSVGTIR